MLPLCSQIHGTALEEDTDASHLLVSQQEDTVITVEEESKPSAKDVKDRKRDKHDKREDKLSDSWDGEELHVMLKHADPVQVCE